MNPQVTTPTVDNVQTLMSQKVYEEATKAFFAKESLVPVGDNIDVGCAISETVILKERCGINIKETLSTADLLLELESNPAFREVTQPLPGDVIISASGTSTLPNPPLKHGHTGCVAIHGILSNNSMNGIWSENYTLETWRARYEIQGGFSVRFFRAV